MTVTRKNVFSFINNVYMERNASGGHSTVTRIYSINAGHVSYIGNIRMKIKIELKINTNIFVTAT